MADEKKYLDKDGVSHLWLKIKSFCSENYNKYVHPTYTSNSNGLYKVTVDTTGHVSDTVAVTKADITALGIPAQDTTYSNATLGASGLMSISDKKKLNDIEEGAEKNFITGYTQLDEATNTVVNYYKLITKTGGYIQVPEIDNGKVHSSVLPEATSFEKGAMSSEDKTKLDAFQSASAYALKSDVTGVYRYIGSVSTENDLPTNADVGDVYNIVNASSYGGQGMNVAWTGSSWDALGEMFNIESITSTELDAICV